MEAALLDTSVYEQLEAAHTRIRMLEADLNQLLGIQPDYAAAYYDAPLPQHDVELLLDSAPIALYTVAWDGTVTFAQGRAFAEIGVRPQQVVGANIFLLFRDDPDVIYAHRQALNGSAARYTTTVVERAFEAWVMPTEGGVVGVVVEAVR
jgi:PAS domain-containing protein